ESPSRRARRADPRRAAAQAAAHRRHLDRGPALGSPLPHRRDAEPARGRRRGGAGAAALRGDGPAEPAPRPRLRALRHAHSRQAGRARLARAGLERAAALRPGPGRRPERSFEDDMRRPTPAPARKLVAALDVGSSKVSALIAEPAADGRLRILGTGQCESKGVKRGFIADMEESELAIRKAVEQAERTAGTNIDMVFVGFSAGGLVSDVASVGLALGGRQITEADIASLLNAGKGSIDTGGRVLLHAMPALYTIDGMAGVKAPRGLHADRLAVDIHVIAAEPSPGKNLDLS